MDSSNLGNRQMVDASALPSQSVPAVNFTMHPLIPRGATTARRGMFTKDQWNEMEPIIRQLYVTEKRPYKDVMEILRTKHRFLPTRTQFYRKIHEWGFAKNVKNHEMRDLLKGENNGVNHNKTFQIRGFTIAPQKIDRWQKKNAKRGGISVSVRTPDGVPMDIDANEDDAEDIERSQIHEPEEYTLEHIIARPPPDEEELRSLFARLDINYSDGLPTTSGHDVPLVDGDYISTEGLNDLYKPKEKTSYVSPDARKVSNSRMIVASSFRNDASNEGDDSEIVIDCDWRDIEIEINIDMGPIHTLSPFPRSPITGMKGSTAETSPSWLSLEIREMEYGNRLSRLKKFLGPENPGTLEAMSELADVYERQYKNRSAERLYRKLACIKTKTIGLHHPETLSLYLSVVGCLYHRGLYLEARRLHEKVHAWVLNLVDPDSSLVLRSRAILARIFEQTDRLQEAVKIQQEILQIRLSLHGPWDSATINAMLDLSGYLLYVDSESESESLLHTILQIQHGGGGDVTEHDKCSSVFNLSETLWKLGLYDQSKAMFTEAAARSERCLGPVNSYTLNCYHCIAKCLRVQGQLAESEDLFRSTLDSQLKTLEEDDRNIAWTTSELGELLMEMKRYEEAISYLEQAFERFLVCYSPENRWTVDTCDNLGRCYEKQGRYEDSLALYNKHLDKLLLVFGEEHWAVLKVRRWKLWAENKIRSLGDEDTESSDDEESGDEKSGDEKSGDEESGDEESGDEESGDEESGDEESGDDESGEDP